MPSFEFIKNHRQSTSALLEHPFARAQVRQPALAEYSSAEHAVRTLRTPTAADNAAKPAVTSALLEEVRGGNSALATVLLYGYLPMLEFLLSFGAGLVPDQEMRESMILEAFFEAVAKRWSPRVGPCLHLRRETRRRYLLAARRFHREQTRVELLGEATLEGGGRFWWEGRSLAKKATRSLRIAIGDCADEVCQLLRQLVGHRVAADKLEVVAATILQGEDLVTYVASHFPGRGAADRHRTYVRLQKERLRTVEALRVVLSPWRLEVLGGTQ